MNDETETFDDSAWFRRFRIPPGRVVSTRRAVEQNRRAVDDSTPGPEELFHALLELAWALTPLGREAEAVDFGERARQLAKELGDRREEIEALLHLGTALQYGGHAGRAQLCFDDALALSAQHDEPEHVHYLLHHAARLKAESGEIETARSFFERALHLRKDIGDDALVKSTQAALEELDSWCADRRDDASGEAGRKASG